MGFRFRKSISLGKGVRLNISKRGVGVSAGVKGARVGIGPRGIRKTASIPGTGISYVKENSLRGSVNRTKHTTGSRPSPGSQIHSNIPTQSLAGTSWVWGIILGFILTFSNPVFGLPLLGLSFYFYRKKIQEPQNKSKSDYNKGVLELKKNNLDKAMSLFESALEHDESNHMARLLMTNIAFSQGKHTEVLAHLDKLPSTVYEDPSLTFAAAISNFSIKEYDKAIPLLQQINSTEGYQDEANIFLGRCFLEKGMYDLAVEAFRKGPLLKRTMTPIVMEAKYWLGLTYYKQGDKKKASTQLTKVYAEDVNFRDVADYIDVLE